MLVPQFSRKGIDATSKDPTCEIIFPFQVLAKISEFKTNFLPIFGFGENVDGIKNVPVFDF